MSRYYVRDAISDRLISEAPDFMSAIMAADVAIEEGEADQVAIYLRVVVADAYQAGSARKALWRQPEDEHVDSSFTETGPAADMRRAQNT